MVLGEEDGRYSFLLKPIRDLTKNWDVDIASHLEEYLEELENVVFTFEGGRTMNFAEAALLIQGSTCVYSRKVEYLYVLVYEVLDLLVSKKRNKQGNAANRNGDGEDPDVTFGDEEIQLLPLDDMEEMDIVMKENEKSVGTIPRRPMSMVPFVGEMGDDQLLSKNGEVLGSRKDFRLNTSQVNRDSCLLLEASAQILSELMNRSCQANGEPLTNDMQTCDTHMTENAEDSKHHDFDAMDDFADDCHDPEEMPLAEPTAITMDEGPKRSERIREKMLEDKAKLCSVPAKNDPWTHQDPFEPKKMTEKSFKKIKTFRIPDSLNEKKSKKRKWTPEGTKQTDMPLVGDFIATTLFSYKQKIPKMLQDSCLPEFEKLCWTKLSERQSKQRVEIKAMETKLEQQILNSEHIQDKDADIIEDVIDDGGVCVDGDDDDDEDVGPVLNWQDDLFNVDPEPQISDPPSTDEPASSYEQLVQKHIEAFYVGAQKYAQTTELSKKIAEWESRILPKLQEEEKYGPYDIHAYGTKVLNSITKGSKISLSKIMAGKPTYEVGRLFLSTLMLANTGNLELSCPGVLEEGMDKAEVTLLRTKLHFEELEEYVAPSLASKDKEN